MRRIIFFLMISAGLFFRAGALADTIYSDQDTMRVQDASGLPGDTVSVYLYMANTTIDVGGISHRITYDSTLIRALSAECLDRGCALEIFAADMDVPGVIRILAYSFESNYIPRGFGNTVRIKFLVKSGAVPGRSTLMQFVDQGLGDNAWSPAIGGDLFIPQLLPGTFQVRGGNINLPPVITNVGNQSVAEGQLLQFTVVAHDVEADPITLSAENLPENAFFPSAQGDSLISSTFSFRPSYTQGPDTFLVSFVAVDDHNNVTTMPVQIVVFDQPNDRLIIAHNQGGIRGAADRSVDVILFNSGPIFGAQFEVLYDPEQIVISDVLSTYRNQNMWFSYNEPQPGRIIIITFSVGMDTIPSGNGPLAELVVDVNDDAQFGHTELSLAEAIEIIDSVTTKNLEPENGYFTVDRFGDANLDETVNVGDCVTIVAYILGQMNFSIRQFEAADIDSSGRVNIGDLQKIINVILEINIPPLLYPSDPPVVVELMDDIPSSGDLLTVPFRAEMSGEASAVQFRISYNSDVLRALDPEPGDLISGMMLDYNVSDNEIYGVIYNLGGGSFGPGNGELVNLNFRVTDPAFDFEDDLAITDFLIVNPAAEFIPVEIEGQLPDRFILDQNYPNPFNAGTNISFSLPSASNVEIMVYDLLGRQVTTLLNSFIPAGSHSVNWDGRSGSGDNLSTGVYFYRLRADGFDETKKMLLIK